MSLKSSWVYGSSTLPISNHPPFPASTAPINLNITSSCSPQALNSLWSWPHIDHNGNRMTRRPLNLLSTYSLINRWLCMRHMTHMDLITVHAYTPSSFSPRAHLLHTLGFRFSFANPMPFSLLGMCNCDPCRSWSLGHFTSCQNHRLCGAIAPSVMLVWSANMKPRFD